jgi:hypothetical protein
MITVYINPKGGFHYIKGRDFFTFNGKTFDLEQVDKSILLRLSNEVKAKRLIQTTVRGINIKNEVFRWRKINAQMIAEYGG